MSPIGRPFFKTEYGSTRCILKRCPNAIFHKNAECRVLHGTEKRIRFAVNNMGIMQMLHQMDLCPAVSMLHARLCTVSPGLDRRVPRQHTRLTSNVCLRLNWTGVSNKPGAQSLICAKGAFQHAGLSC